MDVAPGPRKSGGGEVSSFYFTSFPDSWRARDLVRLFDQQGRVQEVVIPGRRNAQGRRFGFVRFLDVKEPDRLATILDNMFIEGMKIHVNIPRFQRVASHARGQSAKYGANFQKQVNQVWVKKYDCQPIDSSTGKHKEGTWSCNVDTDPRLALAMVGEVILPGKSYYIQDELAQMGVFAIKATPMGSNMVLLEGDKEDGDFAECIEDAREWLDQWFKWIRPWKPSDVDPERSIWLRCYGIPVHAWNSAFFSKLAGRVGEFICVDEDTERKRSFDVARLRIRTQELNMVNQAVKVVINGLPFSISVVEEWGGGVCRSYKDANKAGDEDVDSSADDDLSDGMYSGTGDFNDDVEVGEEELNDLLNAVKISGNVDPQLMDKNLNSFVNDSDDLVGRGANPPQWEEHQFSQRKALLWIQYPLLCNVQ